MPNDTPAALQGKRDLEIKLNGDMILQPDLAAQLSSMIPQYTLQIFNVGPIRHVVTKGSAGPPGGFIIPACEKGKPFGGPLIIPSIVIDTYMIENEIKTHSVTGEFMCEDIVHPLIGKNWSVGQNLDDLGVFWTKNKIPSHDELQAAQKRLELTFREQLAEATGLEAIGDLRSITPLMRHAADYFEEDRPWNKIYRKTAECPGCSQPTKPGTAVHTCGAVLDWHKAIALGMKTKADAERAGVDLEPAVAVNVPAAVLAGPKDLDVDRGQNAAAPAKQPPVQRPDVTRAKPPKRKR